MLLTLSHNKTIEGQEVEAGTYSGQYDPRTQVLAIAQTSDSPNFQRCHYRWHGAKSESAYFNLFLHVRKERP